MMLERLPEEQRLRTLHAMRQIGIDVQQVWIRYFSIGGNVDEFELDAYLHGLIRLTSLDRNMISHAVNELIDEAPRPAAPYDDDDALRDL
ncbi:hypothetical protein GM708_15595 [Vibrio cholerae]|nr:hypothetical protein [Vibrio cholerae]